MMRKTNQLVSWILCIQQLVCCNIQCSILSLLSHTSFEGQFNWHINVLSKKKKSSLFDIKNNALFHFICLLYETRKKKVQDQHCTPSICKMCVCKHAVRSGYNHESKGLKNEQMDLWELQYLFFFSPLFLFILFFFFLKPLLFFELTHQKVSF